VGNAFFIFVFEAHRTVFAVRVRSAGAVLYRLAEPIRFGGGGGMETISNK
jgi:hypothetical protein